MEGYGFNKNLSLILAFLERLTFKKDRSLTKEQKAIRHSFFNKSLTSL